MKKLSVIIPVFNEEKTIQQVLEDVSKVKLKDTEKEIIIVDDHSTDGTVNILNKIKRNKSFKHIRHPQNLGKGAAVRSGLKIASGDFIIIQDADLEYNPQDYPKLIENLLEGSSLVVYGTRLKNYPLKFWGDEKTVLPLHLLANKFLTYLTNTLYNSNLTDMETGYKLLRKEVLEGITLNSKKFDFEPEITAKILKKGIKIKEVPIKINPRTGKEGKKITWKDGFSAIRAIIKYRFFD